VYRRVLVTGAFLCLISSAVFFASTGQAATFTRPLTWGSSGNDVSALQLVLKNAGYFTYPAITELFPRQHFI
jgi:hypothetical protein